MTKEDDMKRARRELAAAGGHARAAKLTKDQKRISAQKAALARHSVPKATHTGDLQIGETTITCAVLEDGTRLLTQEGFLTAIGRAAKAKGGSGAKKAAVDQAPAFLSAENLKPFFSKDLRESTSPVIFKTPGGARAFGYKAALLPEVCDVYLKARDARALARSQQHIAVRAEILMRGLARIGIVALIDEATGYQEDRSKRALQAILDKFIAKEFSAWAKRFGDDFYREMFRLRGWDYSTMNVKRPSVVGRWTTDLVYDRLAPGVRRELEARNPKNEQGNRSRKHHQHLTEDIGHPKLAAHIKAVTVLMTASSTWSEFKRMMDKALPKYQDMPLFPNEQEGE